MALNSAQRSMRSRLAGLTNAATHDPLNYTLAARQSFIKSFFDATDPAFPTEQRLVMAERLRRAHYTRMALASSIARSKRTAAKRAAKKFGVTLDIEEDTEPDSLVPSVADGVHAHEAID
jgi:hypothetical protein